MKMDFVKMAQDNHEQYIRDCRAARYSRKIAYQNAKRISDIHSYICMGVALLCFIISSAVCGVY